MNSQYSWSDTIELNPFSAKTHEHVLKETVCKLLSLTGVNDVSEDFHACHRIKKSSKVMNKQKTVSNVQLQESKP